jgi:2-polyprenyl-6-hydroxyphenyl methylase/3-demethylubiquinone-9 3-methyltransferase
LPGKSVIDVGCGGGILAESMARRGARVTGIDLSEKALKVAQLHALESQIDMTYEHTSAEEKALSNSGAFDIVTCMEMLEHVPDPKSTIEACAKLAKPGGLVFFSTLNRNPKSYLFAIIGAEYILKLLPIGTHEWTRFIKPSELHRMLRGTDLMPIELRGMTYNPFSQRYRLSHDVSVNYLQATRKL